MVTSDGRILTELIDIKEEAVKYYEDFLNGHGSIGDEISEDTLNELIDFWCDAEDAASLVKPVQAEEIQAVLFSMPAKKAPSPDGYPMEFYKAAWTVVGKDLVRLFSLSSFFLFSFMSQSTNVTLWC